MKGEGKEEEGISAESGREGRVRGSGQDELQ